VNSAEWDAMMERRRQKDREETKHEKTILTAIELSESRERKHFRKALKEMSTPFLVEMIRDSAGKMPPKGEDMLLEAATRLEALLDISARSGLQ
jgi:hypothetical protein